MTRSAQGAGYVWVDFGWWVQPAGNKRLLSWNEATKELTFWPLTRWEEPIILAVLTDEDEVRQRLDGWADHNTSSDGLAWLAQRLEGCR